MRKARISSRIGRASVLLGAGISGLFAIGLSATACSSAETDAPVRSASASTRPLNPGHALPPAPRAAADPNPLELPMRTTKIATGDKVFAVPERMLRYAKLGSTLQLRATTVVGKDGDNLVVDGRDGPDYSIHPGYVIPITGLGRVRLGQPVMGEWAGSLKHGVVRKQVKDRVAVRFTDANDKTDRLVDPAMLTPQTDGFRPGNYAVLRVGDLPPAPQPAASATTKKGAPPRTAAPRLALSGSAAAEAMSSLSASAASLEHVLLVSPIGDEANPTKWLAFGYGGAARIVDASRLVAVPVSYEPKENTIVLAEHLGRMRPAIVKEVDKPGIFTLRFDRAGRPIMSGWGLVMPPLAN